jgi:sugar phosphate isomerase/epimerase
MSKIPVALQMYTLRDVAANDFAGTFKKVADLGYAGVELAGTGGLSAAELKKLLDGLGLQIAGNHVGLQLLESDLNAALDYNAEIGNKNVVCPYLPEERRKSADDYKTLAALLNKVGATCKERGMQLCYHNHAFEFDKFEGQAGLDILFENTDPDLVKAELDTYWVKYGGEDPAAYIRKYSGRVPLVHLKDMTNDEKRTFAEVGEGTMDFNAIFEASEEAGVEWYIVEQDSCQRPSLESVEISLRNLKSMGKL